MRQNTSTEHSLVARCGGYELIEDGPRLLFVHRGTDAYSIALFVIGLVSFIVGTNAIIQVALALSGEGYLLLGLGLFVVALASTGLFVAVWRARKTKAEKGVTPQMILLAIDRDAGALLGADGRPFASAEGIVFRSVFQIGSSSRAMELCFHGGTKVVARGSPFTGSIEGFTEALRKRGFRVN